MSTEVNRHYDIYKSDTKFSNNLTLSSVRCSYITWIRLVKLWYDTVCLSMTVRRWDSKYYLFVNALCLLSFFEDITSIYLSILNKNFKLGIA